MDLDSYSFTVRRLSEEEGAGFLAEYPDVPYCIADGETPEAAVNHGRKALEACLTIISKSGDPIPTPGPAAASSGQWRQRVPKSLHARLVVRAEKEGVSLNTLVATLIAEGIGRRDAVKDRP